MSNQDWYRKTNWTKRDKEDFLNTLNGAENQGEFNF